MKKSFLLSSLFAAMCVVMPASADVISMQTAAKVGDKLTIALNENVKATLTWGNGTKQEMSFDGSELEFEVKDASFTIESDQMVTRLYCPDCLLTEVNLDGAPNLTTLVCPDNQLKNLNLSKAIGLVDLNCENNQLEHISLTSNKGLEMINVSNNHLRDLSVTALPNLSTLLCANNELTRLSLTSLKKLNTLWCQGNKIEKIDFSSVAKPSQICAFNNVLKELKPQVISEAKDLWLDNNQLSALDLSSSTVLEVLSASDNLLNLIQLNKDDEKSLKAFYVDGNSLMLNSFPTVYKMNIKDTLVAYNIDNQRPYELVESVNINEKVNLTELIRHNAWQEFARAKIVWKNANGQDLVKNEDFKISGSTYTFLKPFAAVLGEVTSDMYPGAVLRFAPFRVVDPTGIDDLSKEGGLVVSVLANKLQVYSPVPTVVKVYNVGGSLVVRQEISAGTHCWTLPVGLYVVNGQKVVLGR